MKKEKVIECERCAKYSDYYKKGVFKRVMEKIGDVGTGILYQCPNKECNKLKIICQK
jgi:hypothetical protein